MANIAALLKLHRDMMATKSPDITDFMMARQELGEALAEELKAPSNTLADQSDLANRIRMLLAGDLFPPNEYTDKNGNVQVWDDRKFFKDMLGWNREWSQAQVSLIKRRIKYYDDNGHKLRKKSEPEQPTLAPSLGINQNMDQIPF